MHSPIDHPPKKTVAVLSKIAIAVLLFSIALFGAINAYNHDRFMKQSVALSLQLQSLPKHLTYYFWVFTYPVYYLVIIFPFFFIFYSDKKEKALLFLLANLCVLMLSETVQVLVRDTRPCLQNQILANVGCSCSFGMFSGHSSATSTFFFLGYRLFFHKHLGGFGRVAGVLFVIWVVGSVALSRIYFGAHSWNHVLMGLLAGLAFTELIMLLKRPLTDTLKKMLRKTGGSNLPSHFLSWFCFLLYLGCQVLSGVSLYTSLRDFDRADNTWLVVSSCAKTCFADGAILSQRHALTSARMAPFGFLLLLLNYANRPPTLPSPVFRREQWNGFGRVFARFIVFLVVISPSFGGYFTPGIPNVTVALVVTWLCGLAFSFLFVFLSDRLLRACRAHIDGDFFTGLDYRPLDEVAMTVNPIVTA